jgi:hypothetical protein
MSILFLGAATALLASPMYTQMLFREAYEWEKSQVYVDNSAILLGRQLRQVLRELERLNRQLKQIDILHHSTHACALTPGVQQPACQAADKVAESALIRYSQMGMHKSQLSWQSGWTRAFQDLVVFGAGRGGNLKGPREIPLESQRCRYCLLDLFWRVTSLPHFHLVIGEGEAFPREVSLDLKKDSVISEWNYRLRPQ